MGEHPSFSLISRNSAQDQVRPLKVFTEAGEIHNSRRR
jgi:hypothetical protein